MIVLINIDQYWGIIVMIVYRYLMICHGLIDSIDDV